MAVYTFGLTFEDLVYGIPGIDPTDIGPNTRVSSQNLIDWAEDASSLLAGALAKAGITTSASMDVSAHRRCSAAVKKYVAAQAMAALGIEGPIYDQARNEWNQAYAELSNRPQQLGTEYVDRVPSNIDTINADYSPPTWDFKGRSGRNNW